MFLDKYFAGNSFGVHRCRGVGMGLSDRLLKPKEPAEGLQIHEKAALEPPEPFVDAERAGEFLSLRPRRVLELARQGAIPAHPIGAGRRHVWRFRLSELASAVAQNKVFASSATPEKEYARQSPAPR